MPLCDVASDLYEGAPNPEGVAFENGLRFLGFDVLDRDRTVQRDRPEVWEQGGIISA